MTGIVLIQLGTPDAPTPAALRRYLRQFLNDPRVIESAFVRRVVLPLFVLPTRPSRSAEKYRRIWSAETGSPLLHYTRRQTELLQSRLPGVPVRFGMIVGNPPLAGEAREMIAAGVDRLIAVPLFPQYSATTYASATDALFAAIGSERRVPALRVAEPYYADRGYIDALAAVLREDLARLTWAPEHFVVSFHGIPRDYAQRGDPYATHCTRTARALVAKLGWPRDRWTMSYQSLFGRGVWLKPYTDDVLTKLAARGIRRVFVTTPGFASDCLETIDEIGRESAEAFRHAGGEMLHQGRCLNDHPAWIEALTAIVRREGAGWI